MSHELRTLETTGETARGAMASAPWPRAAVGVAPPVTVSTAAVQGGSGPSPLSLFFALRRRLTVALGVAILAAGLCGPAAWFLVPPAKYRARALIQVYAQPTPVIFKTLESEAINGEEYKRYQKTTTELIKSRMVLNAALQNRKVKSLPSVLAESEPIQWLQDKLEVNFVTGSELLEIAMKGDFPAEIMELVNAVTDSYTREIGLKETQRRNERLKMLEDLKDKYSQQIKNQRQMLRELAQRIGTDDRQTLALKQQYALDYIAEVRKELLRIQSDKRRLVAQLESRRPEETLKETAAAVIPESTLARAIDSDPEIVALYGQYVQEQQRLEAEAAYNRKVSRGVDPGVQRLREHVELLRRSLEKKRRELRPIILKELQGQSQDNVKVGGDTVQKELATVERHEQLLLKEIENLGGENKNLTADTLDLQSRQDDFNQVKEAASQIGREAEQLKVERGSTPRIKLIEPADVPRVKDEKKRYMLIGMITLGSFFAGLLGVALLEMRMQKVDFVEEVTGGLGIPLVGSLPMLPEKARSGRALARHDKNRHWHNLLLESIDATRTMLVHASRGGSFQVVMITSAMPGEGKTSLAGHLATSLARSGRKTLLIDADLRKPTIHRLFDLPPCPGLSELLRGEASIETILTPTAIAELEVIPAGFCDQLTLRILAQGGLGGIFSELKERFEFVIVDSSPLLPVADSLMIAQQCDAVLFSILRDVSRKTKVGQAYQRLAALGVRILGAVVTGSSESVYGNTYYEGAGYSSRPPEAVPPEATE